MIQELKGNIWDIYHNNPQSIITITTNGTIKKDGTLVMGRGCALEAKNKFPGIDKLLGMLVKSRGNIPFFLNTEWNEAYISRITTLPVKHNWWENADIELIEQSLKILQEIVPKYERIKVIIPRPGCGNGGLDWNFIKLKCDIILNNDNRFWFISNEGI